MPHTGYVGFVDICFVFSLIPFMIVNGVNLTSSRVSQRIASGPACETICIRLASGQSMRAYVG